MDISDIMEEDDDVLDQFKLITAPLDILKDYLKKCETQEEKITGYTIFLEIIIKNPPFPHHRTRKKRLFFICLMKRDAKCEPQTLSFVPWTTPRPTGT